MVTFCLAQKIFLLLQVDSGLHLLHLEFGFEGSEVIYGIFTSLGKEGIVVHPNFVKVFV